MERAWNKHSEKPVPEAVRVQNSLRYFAPDIVMKFKEKMAARDIDESDFEWNSSVELLQSV